MDLYEPYNISFLDLTDVDHQEQQEILSSLYSANSNVELPWKTENKLAQRTDDLQNGLTNLPTTHTFIPVESDMNTYRGHEEFGTHPNPAVYPTHFTIQPTYFMYSAAPANYQHPFPLNPANPTVIVNNVSFANTINCNQPVSAPTNPNVPFTNYTNEVLPTSTNTTPVEVDAGYYSPDPDPEYVSLPSAISNNTIEATVDVKATEPTPPQQNGTDQKTDAIPNGKKSWASLFNSDKTASLSNKQTEKARIMAVNKQTLAVCPIKHPRKVQFIDPNCYRMGEFLLSYRVDGRTISLQPRGLINRSNYCYINSILQALVACPPMYNLISGLAKQNSSNEKKKATPIIDGICRFVKEFQHLPAGMRVNRRNNRNHKKEQGSLIDYDLPFEPFWVYKMLNGVRSDSFLVEGRQEDAEEFLGCLLNGLNDEILELMKLVRSDETPIIETKMIEQDSDKEWQVMGPKNKGAITRQTDIGKTPVSDIFGGSLKSRIHRAGDQSTYNIQPFFTLQLNIEKVKTVREALEALVSRNQLEGVTSSKTNKEVEAWQQVLLEELPVVLVLHLKCFDFKLDGCTKIVKALEFPIDLKIDSKLLSKSPSPKEKQYKLFAIVYHDGKEATKGHYITDAFHVGYSTWIRYDDASVKTVQEEQVLKPQGTRVPYLLFYRRSDTIRSK